MTHLQQNIKPIPRLSSIDNNEFFENYNTKHNGYCQIDAFQPDDETFLFCQSVLIYEAESQAA